MDNGSIGSGSILRRGLGSWLAGGLRFESNLLRWLSQFPHHRYPTVNPLCLRLHGSNHLLPLLPDRRMSSALDPVQLVNQPIEVFDVLEHHLVVWCERQYLRGFGSVLGILRGGGYHRDSCKRLGRGSDGDDSFGGGTTVVELWRGTKSRLELLELGRELGNGGESLLTRDPTSIELLNGHGSSDSFRGCQFRCGWFR